MESEFCVARKMWQMWSMVRFCIKFFSSRFFSVSLLKSGENVRNRINSYSWQHCNALARPSSWISTTKKFSMSRAPSNSRSYIDCVEQNQWKNFGWWPSVISSIWMNIFVSACWCQFNSPIDLQLNLEWMLRTTVFYRLYFLVKTKFCFV